MVLKDLTITSTRVDNYSNEELIELKSVMGNLMGILDTQIKSVR